MVWCFPYADIKSSGDEKFTEAFGTVISLISVTIILIASYMSDVLSTLVGWLAVASPSAMFLLLGNFTNS
jgi:hypothetical protein